MKLKFVVFDTDDDLEVRVYNSQGNRIGTSKLNKKEVKDGDLFSSSSRVYEFDIDIITPKDIGKFQPRGSMKEHFELQRDKHKNTHINDSYGYATYKPNEQRAQTLIDINKEAANEPGTITLIWYEDKTTKKIKATRRLKIFTPCKGHLEDYKRYDTFKVNINPNYHWSESERIRLKKWYEQDVLTGRAND